jgi:aspartate 1-decarboxylase
MMFKMLYGKLHRATVSHSDMHYEGSLGIDRILIDAAGFIIGQQIDVLNINNGERFTTYIIAEAPGSKKIGVYGAAAHKAKAGDRLIIIAYGVLDEKEARAFKPKVLVLDEKNDVVGNG